MANPMAENPSTAPDPIDLTSPPDQDAQDLRSCTACGLVKPGIASYFCVECKVGCHIGCWDRSIYYGHMVPNGAWLCFQCTMTGDDSEDEEEEEDDEDEDEDGAGNEDENTEENGEESEDGDATAPPDNPWLLEESSRGTSLYSDCTISEYDSDDDDDIGSHENNESYDAVTETHEPFENATRQLQEAMTAITRMNIEHAEQARQGKNKAKKEIASLKKSLSTREGELEYCAKQAQMERDDLQSVIADLRQSLDEADAKISLLEDTRTKLEKKNKDKKATIKSMKGMLDPFSDE